LDTFDENVLITDKKITESLQSEKNMSLQGEEDDDESIKDLQLDSEDEVDIDLEMGDEGASHLNSQSVSSKINEKEMDQKAVEGIYSISSNV